MIFIVVSGSHNENPKFPHPHVLKFLTLCFGFGFGFCFQGRKGDALNLLTCGEMWPGLRLLVSTRQTETRPLMINREVAGMLLDWKETITWKRA